MENLLRDAKITWTHRYFLYVEEFETYSGGYEVSTQRTRYVLLLTRLYKVIAPLESIPDLQSLGQQWCRVIEAQDLELINPS